VPSIFKGVYFIISKEGNLFQLKDRQQQLKDN